MKRIVRWLKRMVSPVLGLGLAGQEESALGPYALEELRSNLSQLRAAAVRVIANRYRIERMLYIEQGKLSEIERQVSEVEASGNRDLLRGLQLRRDSCRSRIADLDGQLEAAKMQADEAREQLERFQNELQDLSKRVRDAQIEYQLSTMRAQAERFALNGSLDNDVRVIERMEERADLAHAEAEALAELKAALGLSEGRSEK